MTRKQRLGFFLAGLTFVLGGAILAACGWIYAITSLKGQGVMFVLAGAFVDRRTKLGTNLF
jgi:hypothetical protein